MINGCVVFKYKLKLLTLHFGTNKTNKEENGKSFLLLSFMYIGCSGRLSGS